MRRLLRLPVHLLAMLAGGACLGLLVVALVPASSSLGGTVALNSRAPKIRLSGLAVPSEVYDSQGHLLGMLQDSDYRKPVPLSMVPRVVERAVLDVEDRNYFKHGPVDVSSIFRALKSDLTSGTGLQGGSTIAQQLVKQDITGSKRTLGRKIRDAMLAIRLSKEMSKQAILQRYLNTVYFGNGAYGVEAASLTYFNKPVTALDPAEAALLAGMIENPSYYDPITNPGNARYRRNLALGEMVRNHDLSPAQAAAGKREPLPRSVNVPSPPPQSTFMEEVVHQLLSDPRLGKTPADRYKELYQGGLKIYTTWDPTMQAQAENAVSQVMPNTHKEFTAALVAVDPHTGEVKALVSGNPAGNVAGFDVVTGLGGGGGRQPGSSFKLFTLLASLEHGYSVNDLIDGDSPCYFNDPGAPGGVYEAQNAEPGGGIITLTTATAESVNCAYIRLGLDVGLPYVVQQAKKVGDISLANPSYMSLIIGGEGVEPIDMASAYAAVADNGIYHQPTFVDHVTGPKGQMVIPPPGPGKRVMPAWVAESATAVLQHVLEPGGTAGGEGLGRPAAGKTGTTDNYTNAWFDGFTPQLATVVWMGDPKGQVSMQYPNTPITVFGGTYPAEVWHQFMTSALANQPVMQFAPPPPGVPAFAHGHYLPPPSSDVSGQHGKPVPSTLPPPTTTTTVPFQPAPLPPPPPVKTTPITTPPTTTPPTTTPPTTTPPTTTPPPPTTTTTRPKPGGGGGGGGHGGGGGGHGGGGGG